MLLEQQVVTDMISGCSGRYLWIAKTGSTGHLALCEVEVYEGCYSCPANSYSAQMSTGIDKCKCNVGYTSIDGENCEACAPGTYKSVTTTDDSRGPYGRWLMDACPQNDNFVADPLMAAAHEALGSVVCCTGILLLVYVCARVCMC